MKRNAGLVLALVCMFAVVACGTKASGEAEAAKLAKDMTTLMDTTAKKLDASTNAKDAADVIVSYAAAQKELIIRGKELSKKYPNLSSEPGRTQMQSEEAKEQFSHFTKSFSQATAKYMMAPEMRDALKKMSDIMQSIK